MNFSVLARYFTNANEQDSDQLIALFDQLEAIEKSFYAIIVEEKGKYKFGYSPRSIETQTGYPIKEFSYHGGSPFFYSITPPDYRQLVLDQEMYFFKKARQKAFDVFKPFIVEIDGALQHQSGRIMDVKMIGVVLEFTVNRVPGVAINFWQIMDELHEQEILRSRLRVESTLREIHKVYFQLNQQRLTQPRPTPADPLWLSYPLYDTEEITKREYLVLKLIADGLSSQKIADKLYVSVHTAETHRRHLLQKFKAQNVAELIKKASKLFWFE
jgi:DNA-binding CsgD family transcriptional regulator